MNCVEYKPNRHLCGSDEYGYYMIKNDSQILNRPFLSLYDFFREYYSMTDDEIQRIVLFPCACPDKHVSIYKTYMENNMNVIENVDNNDNTENDETLVSAPIPIINPWWGWTQEEANIFFTRDNRSDTLYLEPKLVNIIEISKYGNQKKFIFKCKFSHANDPYKPDVKWIKYIDLIGNPSYIQLLYSTWDQFNIIHAPLVYKSYMDDMNYYMNDDTSDVEMNGDDFTKFETKPIQYQSMDRNTWIECSKKYSAQWNNNTTKNKRKKINS